MLDAGVAHPSWQRPAMASQGRPASKDSSSLPTGKRSRERQAQQRAPPPAPSPAHLDSLHGAQRDVGKELCRRRARQEDQVLVLLGGLGASHVRVGPAGRGAPPATPQSACGGSRRGAAAAPRALQHARGSRHAADITGSRRVPQQVRPCRQRRGPAMARAVPCSAPHFLKYSYRPNCRGVGAQPGRKG